MLGGLLLAGFVGLVLVAACVSAFVSSTPRRTLDVASAEVTPGLPRFYPLPSFGADADGRTFGVWVAIAERGDARAFFSRDPGTGCFVAWRGDTTVAGVRGVFREGCEGISYDIEGSPIEGPAARGLDGFDIEVESTRFVVDLEQFRLGICSEGIGAHEAERCSAPGQPRYADRQPPAR